MDIKTEISGFYKKDDKYLINKDNDALMQYKKKKNENKKMKSIESDLLNMKSDLLEIKNLLKKMVK